MEDYIFIIIAIVLSIIGAYNQNKKKKDMQNQQTDADLHSEPSFFEQIFDDPVFQEEEIQVEPVPEKVPEVKIENKITRQPLQSTKRHKMEIGGSARKRSKPIFEEENEERQETRRESIMNDFSLKKAILYSEIINRKY